MARASTREIDFVKMQGIGNDYLFVDVHDTPIENPGELSVEMSDRHFGVGSDGLILVGPSEVADFRMRIFNADGSEAQMCGNGIRCLAKYVYDRKLTRKRSLTVETGRGVLTLKLKVAGGVVEQVTVDMGEPILERSEIPMLGSPGRVIDEPLTVADEPIRVTAVSMGNPHCITFVDEVASAPVTTLGPKVEHHGSFPEGVNVEFVQVLSKRRLLMRVWERGSGETMACGTGACAACVAGVLNGLTYRAVTVELTGGCLTIEWDKTTDRVTMEGPAEFVFSGHWTTSIT